MNEFIDLLLEILYGSMIIALTTFIILFITFIVNKKVDKWYVKYFILLVLLLLYLSMDGIFVMTEVSKISEFFSLWLQFVFLEILRISVILSFITCVILDVRNILSKKIKKLKRLKTGKK